MWSVHASPSLNYVGSKILSVIFNMMLIMWCSCVFQDMLRWFVSFWRPAKSTQCPETGTIMDPKAFHCGSEEFAGPGRHH